MENAQKYTKIIGEYVCQKRQRAGMTQEKVSEQIGISRSNIAKYEFAETEMKVSTLPALCSLYNCRVAECGELLDKEICDEKVREMAIKASDSPFMQMHYIKLMTGADKPKEEYPVIGEEEFMMLVRTVTSYIEHITVLHTEFGENIEDIDRLISNISLFMLEFIEYNEPRKEVREHLQEVYRSAIKDYLKK